MFVATHYSSDSGQVVDFTNTDGLLAFDLFLMVGRPMVRAYNGITE
jgi:hypothetical protein